MTPTLNSHCQVSSSSSPRWMSPMPCFLFRSMAAVLSLVLTAALQLVLTAALPLVLTATSANAADPKVQPLVEGVQDNQDGSYTVFFGFQNTNTVQVGVPIGPTTNYVRPGADNQGQPVLFPVGRSGLWPNCAFSVITPSSGATWTVTGSLSGGIGSGTPRSVTGNSGSPRVPLPLPNLPPNAVPVVAITAPTSNSVVIPGGGTVSFVVDAYDLDGVISTVQLREGATVLGSKSPSGKAQTPFSLTLAPGTHILTATATDDSGQTTVSATCTVIIRVAPTLTLVRAGSTPLVHGGTVALTATASDSDGTITKVDFTKNGALGSTVTAAPYTWTATGLTAPVVFLGATATDNNLLTASRTLVEPVLYPPTVSLTYPTSGLLVQPQAGAISLIAAASDTDGTVSSVQFQVNGVIAGMVVASPYRYQWLVPAGATSATVVAIATDASGLTTSTAPVTFTINQMPSITITQPLDGAVVQVGDPLPVSASAADPDGTIISMLLLRNGMPIGQSSTTTLTSAIATATPASFVLTVQAFDSQGGISTSAPRQVRINAPPAVALTAPASGAVVNPGSIPLTATAADADGTVTKVEFYADAVFLAADTTAPYAAAWTAASAGFHTLEARVTDNDGAVRKSTLNVTVNAAPTVTWTAPAANAAIAFGQSVALALTAADSDGSIASVVLREGATTLATLTAPPYGFTMPNPILGQHVITASVTDNRGAVTTVNRTFTINGLPTVAITSPASGTVVTAPASLTLTATAADADGSIAQVAFMNGPTVLGTATTAPYQITTASLAAGTYTITAVATDNRGGTVTSSAVTVVLNARPVVAFAAPLAGGVLGQALANTLAVSATDVDGTIARVVFTNGATVLGTVMTPRAGTAIFSTTATFPTQGALTLTATATDDRGVTSQVSVSATVARAPVVTLTAPSSNVAIAPGTNLALSASASDAGGTITNVVFRDGATDIVSDASAPYQGTWSANVYGAHVIAAVATNNLGAQAVSAPVTVTVTDLPQVTLLQPAPGTVFSEPLSNLVLTAQASDRDGTIAKIDFFAGVTKVGSATAAPYQCTVASLAPGSYNLTAVAVDDLGGTSTSSVVPIRVNGRPRITLLTPVTGTALTINDPYQVTVEASDRENIAQVNLLAGSTIIAQATAAPWTLSPVASAAQAGPGGAVSLTAQVVDGDGLSALSAVVPVIYNQRPTCQLALANPGSAYDPLVGLALLATAADSDGTVAKVVFSEGDTVLGEATTAPYRLQWFGSGGAHALTAVAIDNRGAVGRSGVLTITVNALPQVAMTAPLNGAVIQAPANVTLTATASDSDGTIAKVEFKRESTSLGTVTAAPYQLALSNLAAGTYTIAATATDHVGGVRISAPITFTVAGGPTVALTAPVGGAVLTGGTAVSLTATAAVPGGTISQVLFLDGATVVAQADAAPFNATWLASGSGSHSLTAQARTNAGLTATSLPVVVTVNAPPTVALAVQPGSAIVTLTATAADSDGSVIQVRFLANGTLLATDTTAPYTFDWINPAVAMYTVVAEATDNRGAVVTSTPVVLTVNSQAAVPPTVALTAPANGAKIVAGTAITITATAAPGVVSGVPIGTVARVEFYDGATKLGQSTTAPYAFVWNSAPSGRHGIAALAVSSSGASAVSTQALITVNSLPTASLTAPGAGAVVVAGASLTLTADAVDSDGVITEVAFLDGATVLGTATAKPYRLILPTGLTAGVHTVKARATDDLGGITTTPGSALTVNRAPTIALTAPTAGVQPAGTTITLSATASDADGTIAQVQFLSNGQPLGTPLTAAPFQTTLVNPASGTYALSARVTDNLGASTVSANVTIQVDRAPTVAITVPAPATVIATGRTVAIAALASDSDGTVVSVRFLVDGTTLSTATAAPYTATWKATSGNHQLTAIATDDLGRTTTSAAVSIIGNAPPAVAISAPLDNAQVAAGQAVPVTMNVSDDGTIASVALFDGSTRLALLTAAPYTYTWTAADERTHDLTAVATDNLGIATTSATVGITVAGTNRAPVVSLTKPTATVVAFAGDTIPVAATASDPDGTVARVEWTIDGALVASASTPISGTLFSSSAVLPLTAGTHVVVARATDNQGRRSLSPAVTITVRPAAQKPTITLMTPISGEQVRAIFGTSLTAQAAVSTGTIAKVEFFANGVLLATDATAPYAANWVPTVLGPVMLRAVATDSSGGTAATADIPVTVVSGDLTIVITKPIAGVVLSGQATPVSASVLNANAVSSVIFYANGVAIGTDSSEPYQISWTPTTVAEVTLTATVFDYGQTKTSAPVVVQVRTDNGQAPTATITNPSTDNAIVGGTGIQGAITIPNPAATLTGWTLTIVGEGSNEWPTTIATGTTTTVSAALDSSTLINGIYLLRLTATDSFGRSKVAYRRIQVEDVQKPGEFSFTVQDVVTPVSGIPLAVNRTYNSLNRDRAGDFGYGWSASFTDMEMKIDEERVETVSETFENISVRTGAGGRDVSVTLPDGTRTTFAFHIAWGRGLGYAGFRSTSGVAAQLGVWPTRNPATGLPTNELEGRLPPPSPIYWTGTYGPYNSPWEIYDLPGFVLTLEDGTQYYFKREDLGDHYTTPGGKYAYVHLHYYGKPYLDHIVSPSGDTIQISTNGLQHTNALGVPTRKVVYQRDAQQRITSVYDANAQDASGAPSGPATMVYSYTSGGDLASAKKLVNAATAEYDSTDYFYEDARFPHYLTKIVGANGQPAMRIEYDAQGKVVAVIDAQGNRSTVTSDKATRTTTVYDRNGRPTTQLLDERGRVLSSTDALGNTTTQTYDAYGKLASETDALGHTTTYTNDAKGHRLSETDALGNSARWTYDAQGHVLTSTDKNGRVTSNTYTAQGDLSSTTDALGNVTLFTYTGNHELASQTDALGRVTTYGYDSSGNLAQMVDALGNVTTFGYDGNGNQLWQQVTRTRADGIRETLTTTMTYDRYGRVLSAQNPDGTTSYTVYGKQGKPTSVVNALLQATTFDYNTAGQLLRTTYADGTHEDSTYDKEGRALTRIDRLGRVTTYTYDAVGRLTSVLTPDGSSTWTAYDAAGRVSSTTDAAGAVTTFGYDVVNRRTSVTNALAQTTTFAFDAVGNQTTVTDALNRVTSFTYDALDRRTLVTLPDATTTRTTYDAVGQRVAETDQAGVTTGFVYDALGRLNAVVDAVGKVTLYTYDEVGNQIGQQDAMNRLTSYAYDRMGRRLARTLPGGQREQLAYDAGGNLLSARDFRGYTTTFTYDALNRRLSKTPDSRSAQPAVQWTYQADGRRATMVDGTGTTTYGYDARGRLAQVATPRGTLGYAYDARGNLARMVSNHVGGIDTRYAYDALGRLATITDAAAGTVTYGYDAVGNLASQALPNGISTAWSYDRLSRLTQLTRRTQAGAIQASATYTLDAVGRRTQVAESGGRTAGYTYDTLSRLIAEGITGGASPGAIGYQYDSVGNRQVRTSTSAAVPAAVKGYNANDWLTSDTYDANGNTTVSAAGTDAYDADNHLTQRTLPAGAGTVTIVYDGDGTKVAETANGVTTTFLVSAINPSGYAQTVEELVGATVTRSYVWGLGLAPVAQRSGGAVSYSAVDGQGSVRALLTSAGVVSDTYEYDAFGILIGRTGTTANRYLYCGYEFCEPVGQYYLRARYYDQGKGRFANMDPYEGDSNDVRTLHKFTYCGNDSINGSDPSGNDFSIGSLMASMAGFANIRASYTMNVISAGASSAKNIALITLAPVLRMIGELPVRTRRGQSVGVTDMARRFLVADTVRHPPVSAGWMGRMLQRLFPGLRWEQGHIFIQKKWFAGSALNQLYPNDPAARRGLQRLGNAGINLMAQPRWLNNRLGRSRIGTFLFGGAVTAITVIDIYTIYYSSSEAKDLLDELLVDED